MMPNHSADPLDYIGPERDGRGLFQTGSDSFAGEPAQRG